MERDKIIEDLKKELEETQGITLGEDILPAVRNALKAQQEDIVEMVKEMKLIFSENTDMWCRKGTGALYTNNEETAEIENQAIHQILTNLTKEQYGKRTKSSKTL